MVNFKMKKKYRVKKNQEFQDIMLHHNSYANRNLVVYVLENDDQTHYRIGLSVGKKVGNAVVRNKVKRQLREGVAQISASLKTTINVIIIARPGIEKLSTAEVITNLIHVSKLAKLLNEDGVDAE